MIAEDKPIVLAQILGSGDGRISVQTSMKPKDLYQALLGLATAAAQNWPDAEEKKIVTPPSGIEMLGNFVGGGKNGI